MIAFQNYYFGPVENQNLNKPPPSPPSQRSFTIYTEMAEPSAPKNQLKKNHFISSAFHILSRSRQ